MLTKTTKFKGIDSGDCECGCFAVTPKTYNRITGHVAWQKNPFHRRRTNLYPGDLMPEGLVDNTEYEFEVTVTAKPIRKENVNDK